MYSHSLKKPLASISDQIAIDDGQIVLGFNVSSDGKYLLTYTDNGNLSLFDISEPQKITSLETNIPQHNCIFSIDGLQDNHPPQIIFPIADQRLPKMLIMIYTVDDGIEFWDPSKTVPYFVISSSGSPVRQFHFTAEYSKILIVTENNLISIFDLITKAETNLNIYDPALKDKPIKNCYFASNDENILISFHDSPLHTVYFAEKIKMSWSLNPISRIALDSTLLKCQISPRRDKLLISSKHIIRICENKSPWSTVSIIQHQIHAKNYYFNADETILIVGCKKTIQVFLTATGQFCFRIQKIKNILSVDCSPGNRIFTIMLESGLVDIHCLQTGKLLTSISDPDLRKGGMSGVCAKFSPDGLTVFTLLDVTNCIKCWTVGLASFIGMGEITAIIRNQQRGIRPNFRARLAPKTEPARKKPCKKLAFSESDSDCL